MEIKPRPAIRLQKVQPTTTPPAKVDVPAIAKPVSSSWIPSGADISHPTPPREDLPVLDVVAAQTRPPIDGKKWVTERLAELSKLVRLGVPVTVVFDLDNTVFDTRTRTLHAAKAFDAANGTDHFAGVDVADMQVDGRSTAIKLGLADAVIEGFAAFWEKSFWTPAHLAHDVPIPEMVDLVKRAQEAGATVKFLTGRIETFHGDTMLALKRAGLDVNPTNLVCKPSERVRTAPFKDIHLKAWSSSSELGFFVTEGTRDLLHMKGFLPDVPLLRLDCTFEDPKGLAHVPVWPRFF
ncbi:MAG: hypothetical protein Q8O67_12585 [Deltaproteobacteria bacterium]|nr:hypothetical protein [Deltaproteobacteria bacterium]